MSQSLDKLSSNLPEDRFIYTGEEIDGGLDLMKKKGVYPYDYMDSSSRFNENKLPKREEFYIILNLTVILVKMIISMLRRFGMPLRLEILVNTMTCI